MRLLSTGKYDSNYFPPTKKFRITNIKLPSGVKLVCWDMPGQKIFRSDWLRGAQASNILLFILDLADSTQFEEAREELNNMLDLYELQNIPLLFLGNKTDLSEAVLDQEYIVSQLGLNNINDRELQIIFGSVAQNTGIPEVVQWMENKVQNLLLAQNFTSADVDSNFSE